MNVKELKEQLEQFDENLIVEVKDDCGEYDMAEVVYEDEEEYASPKAYAEFLNSRKPIEWKTRKVLRIG